MHIIIKIKKFIALSFKEQFFFIQAYYYFILFYLIPPKSVSDTFNLENYENYLTVDKLNNNKDIEMAQKIAQMIKYASSYTPWINSCLINSFVAKKILEKEKISGKLYIGVKKDNLKMKAHAWVECSGKVILGVYNYKTYKIIAISSWIANESSF